ncbi:glutathione S-transferase Ure2-like protein [Lipomyces kononenkoae]
MSSLIKPIKVWGKIGPNPTKVAILFEELDLPYEVVELGWGDIKKAEYLAVNPNGRIPAIHDPNTGLTLWESGAIIEYLLEKYDTTYKLSFPPGSIESYHAKQWLFFQVSGQGPYYGQASWFNKFHDEKVPSAIERYVKEVSRVTGVLEGHLAQQKVQADGDGPWLVGNKYSYVDLAFISWQTLITKVIGKSELYNIDEFPHVKQWLGRMGSRKQVQAVLGEVKL